MNKYDFNKISIVLTGFDDVCIRSNSIHNFILINKIDKEYNFKKCDVYIHPSEWKVLYSFFINNLNSKKKYIIYNKWLNKKYDMVFTVYSSLLNSFDKNQDYFVYDPNVPKKKINLNIKNIKFL
tara:strand:+ start:28 stop:399 length:372 start_codon:yes stop_codon:yes gene_type:complete